MALKMTKSGQYVVRTKKDAEAALTAMRELQENIEEIEKENDLPEMRQDAVELKKAAQRWMEENDEDQIQCDGFHGTLVRASYDKRWIATDDELESAGNPDGAISLKRILKRKIKNAGMRKIIWMRMTKRVADPEGIDEVVAEGILSADDVAPAFVEKTKAPYLRLFDDE